MQEKDIDSKFMDEDVFKRVPESAKYHWFGFLMIFVGMWTALSAIGIGVDVGTQLTPWKASLAFLCGYIICMIFGFFVGEIGRRESLGTAVLCERPFSKFGKLLPVLAIFLVAGAFIGVQADAIARLGMDVFGIEVRSSGFDLRRGLISAGLCTLMMYTSYKGIKYIKLISWISVPIFLTVLITSFALTVSNYPGGLSAILVIEANEVSFTSVMFLGVSLFAGFSAFMPDVSRFVRTRTGLLKALLIGFIGSTFIPVWGVIVGAAQGADAYWTVLSSFGLAFSVFAVFGMFLAQWTTNDNNAFSSGLALSVIFRTFNEKYKSVPRLTRKKATLVPATFGVILAFVGSGAVSSILSLVGALGSWLVPMAGVLIAHYYFVEKGGKKVQANGLAGITSFIVIGLLTQLGLMPFAAITAIISSILLYLVVYYGIEKPFFGYKEFMEEEIGKEIV